MSEHFEDFKRNINNPYNIKGFYKLFNQEYIKENIDLALIESKILGEAVKPKIDTKALINDILLKAIPNTNKRSPSSLPTPATFGTNNNTPIKPDNIDFIKFNDYSNAYRNNTNVSTLEKQLEDIELSTIKTRIKEILKEIKFNDKDFDCELYMKFINNPEIDQHNLNRIKAHLESELGSYEGRSLVMDFAIAGTGLLEGYFDGTKSVLGYKPDLTGLSDTFELSLRKRKIETATIYRQGKELIGLGPVSQIGLDLLVTTVITAQKNQGKSSETQKAIKLRERLNS